MEYDDKCQVGDYNDMLSQAHKLALSSTSRAGATFRKKGRLRIIFYNSTWIFKFFQNWILHCIETLGPQKKSIQPKNIF